jgi:voltage-gated potassium channel
VDPEDGPLLDQKKLSNLRRRDLARVLLQAFGMSVCLLALYFLLPTPSGEHNSAIVQLSVGLIIFIAVLVQQVGGILKSAKPIRRGIVALAVILPLFIVVFASTYLTMSALDPNAFTEQLGKANGLYFTVTVLSTVGFGDITPVTDAARMVVAFQMVVDLVIVAMGARLLLGATASAMENRPKAP